MARPLGTLTEIADAIRQSDYVAQRKKEIGDYADQKMTELEEKADEQVQRVPEVEALRQEVKDSESRVFESIVEIYDRIYSLHPVVEYGKKDVKSSELTTGWNRVTSDKIPIMIKGVVHVVVKAYGSKVYIQHLRRDVQNYGTVNVVKTESFDSVSGRVYDFECNFNIKADGQDFIAVCGAYLNNTTITTGYRQLSASYDVSKTSYTGFATANSMTADCAYYVYVVPNIAKPLNGKIGVCFGDSITEGIGLDDFEKAYTEVISEYTGASFINCGIGGTRMSYRGNDPLNKWCFSSIAEAIASGDIGTPLMTDMTPLSDNEKNNLWKLYRVDFSKVDFITIAYGTNDWGAGVVDVDNESNKLDRITICGALRYGIDLILAKHPHLKIYVFSPCYRDRKNAGDGLNSDENANSKGVYLYDVADAIVKASNDMHIPSKNVYREGNVGKRNASVYLSDGLHRTEVGYKLLGEQYAKFILSH